MQYELVKFLVQPFIIQRNAEGKIVADGPLGESEAVYAPEDFASVWSNVERQLQLAAEAESISSNPA